MPRSRKYNRLIRPHDVRWVLQEKTFKQDGLMSASQLQGISIPYETIFTPLSGDGGGGCVAKITGDYGLSQ